MQKKTLRQLSVIIAALLIPIVPFVIIGELPGDKWLSSVDDNALLFGLAGSGILVLDMFIPVPSSIVGSLLGARLGFWGGFVATWSGLLIGHMFGYGVARFALGRLQPQLPEAPAMSIVFLSRPVPVLAEAIALTAGANGMPITRFMIACAAGNGIYAAALAANGATLLPKALIGPGLLLPMLLPVIAWLLWRWLAPAGKQPNRRTR